MLSKLILLFLPITVHTAAEAYCWAQAGQRYGVAPELLHAIAGVESNFDSRAVNKSHYSRTRSYDIGLMQINSSHLPALKQHGITEEALFDDPCTNVHVGAWLLSQSLRRHGPTWNALGAYNASCSRLKGDDCAEARAKYAWRVYRRLNASVAVTARVRPALPTMTLVRVTSPLH